MVSEYQKKKFDHLFKALDANKDGRIDPADLELVVERVAATRGPNADTARLKELADKYRFMHQGLIAMADTDGNGDVSLTEWQAYMDKVVNDKAMYTEVFGALTKLFHEIIDHDGDDKNDFQDYKAFLGVLEADVSEAENVFKAIDKDGDGYITLNDLNTVLDDFYLGTEAGPGTYFFGKF